MDEHLFMVLAKLKADRLKLRQEQLRASPVAPRARVSDREREGSTEPRLVRGLKWREQS